MNAAPRYPRSIAILLGLALLVACQPQPPSPTPIAEDQIVITQITLNEKVTGQIIQTKTFDQCKAASSFNSQVVFSDSSSETTHKELVLTESAKASASIPLIAEAELEGAIEERFAVIKENYKSHQESIAINVPAHTRQEYTINWRETRQEGTIEYTVNGQPRTANYSYRLGLEFVSATGSDIDCSLPTATPVPTDLPAATPVLATVTPQPRTLADNCIFTRTWTPDSPAAGLVAGAEIQPGGCFSLDAMGLFADQGSLHLFKETLNNRFAAGLYTPLDSNSVIEFDLYINSLSMQFDDVAEVIFAVTPANDRLTAKPTTRFKLHLEDPGSGKVIHFMMADAGENNGVKLGNQHYEYGRTYNIRLALSPTNQMDVFINGYRINETLELPLGPKALYIGYTLPVYTTMDLKISNLTVNGLTK